MAESLGSSVLDLSVDASKLESGLQKAEGTTKGRMSQIGGLIGKAAKAATAAFAAAGAAAITAAFQTAKYGDEVAKTAPKLGISTDALQEFNFWAERNGVSSGNLERALGRLNQRIGDGTAEGSKYAEKLNEMGVATLDASGNIRETEDVFTDTIMALQGIEEPALQSAMAAEIFGTKLGRDLMPALQDTSLSIDEAREMAQELGLVMDGDALQAAERFQDQWADIKDQIGAFIREAAIPLMTFMADVVFPAISQGITVLRRLFDAFREGRTAAEGFADAASLIGEGLGALFGRLIEAAQNIFGQLVDWLTSGGIEMILNGLLEGRQRLFDAALELFPVILQALVDLIPEIIRFILGDMLPALLDAGIAAIGQLIEAVQVILPQLLDVLFNELLPEVVDTVLEMLPDLLDAAINLFTALVDALVAILPDLVVTLLTVVLPALIKAVFQMLPTLLGAAVRLFGVFVTGVFRVWGALLGALGDVAKSIFSAVAGWGSRMFEAGKEIVQNLIDGIRRMIGKVGDAMKGVGAKIRNFLPFSPAKEGPLSGRGAPDRAGEQIADMVAGGIRAGEADVALAMARITHMDVDVTAGLSPARMRDDVGRGMGGIEINVQGAIDPEGTARTILRTLRDAERRTGERLRF